MVMDINLASCWRRSDEKAAIKLDEVELEIARENRMKAGWRKIFRESHPPRKGVLGLLFLVKSLESF
jgi:hypothetical protein